MEKGHEPRASPAGSALCESLVQSPSRRKASAIQPPLCFPRPERQTWRRNRSRGELLIRAVNSWTLCWYYFAHNGHAERSHQLGRRSESRVTAKDDTGLPVVKVCFVVSLCDFLYDWVLVWVCVSVYSMCMCAHFSFFFNRGRWLWTEGGATRRRWGKKQMSHLLFPLSNAKQGATGAEVYRSSLIFNHMGFIYFLDLIIQTYL